MRLFRTFIVLLMFLLMACLFAPKTTPPIPLFSITADAQGVVKIGIDPPTDNPSGYQVSQDGGTSTFVPLPAVVSCNDFFTGAANQCVAFSFTFTTNGPHSVSIASQSVGGTSAPATLSFNLTIPQGALHLRPEK